MSAEFNASDYSTIPTISAALTLSLSRRLIAEMPKRTGKSVQVAADRLRQRANSLRAQRLKALERPTVDTRSLDQNEDNAWRGLHDRLHACTRLSDKEYTEKVARAADILASLFPNGLRFLTLTYKEQWVESDRILELIEQEKLASNIDQLAGEDFLAQVRTAHAAYGEALGLTQAKPNNPAPAIADALTALREGMRFYARRVVALADEEDPESIALVAQALSPIKEAQEEARARRASGEAEPEPEDEGEIPPLTDEA